MRDATKIVIDIFSVDDFNAVVGFVFRADWRVVPSTNASREG